MSRRNKNSSSRRKRLGQHILVDRRILEKIMEHARISRKHVVLEIGTGTGVLTKELCRRARRVISCEVDPELARRTGESLGACGGNLTLVRRDGFKTDYDFDLFVSNLPYSRSRTAIEWLAEKDFDRAVILVQKEFAEKLLSKKGGSYRAVSALAQYCFEIEELMPVGRNAFRPRPKVDSVMLGLKKRRKVSRDTIRSLKLVFSFRRKKLSNALRKLGLDTVSEKRVEQLTPEEAVRLAEEITK
ncbi:MAG: 16S rRNA (adenine(1518)-N(6)/adenine(1519)-N(6))-dimethyltransferase RsmA [Nitrososphaerales archaeon]